jgi:hypothetical protein
LSRSKNRVTFWRAISNGGKRIISQTFANESLSGLAVEIFSASVCSRTLCVGYFWISGDIANSNISGFASAVCSRINWRKEKDSVL